MPFIALAIAVAAALGGGATLAAESSLPGDALWSYKVHVTENIRSSLAGSAEARAHAHIDAIESRVRETEHLAVEGRLDAEAQKSVAANFDAHAAAVAKHIGELEAAGRYDAAADVAARYQAAVAVSAAALASANTTTEADLSPIILKVRATLDEASGLSASASAKAAAQASTGASTSAGVDAGLDTAVQVGI